MNHRNNSLRLWSSLLLCGFSLLNSSCATGTRVSLQPFEKSKDKHIAKEESGRKSLFARKKYHAVDPFLVDASKPDSKLAASDPKNPDLPEKAGNSVVNTSGKDMDFAPVTTANADKKNSVITWEEFQKNQNTQPSQQAGKQQNNTSTDDISIAKLGVSTERKTSSGKQEEFSQSNPFTESQPLGQSQNNTSVDTSFASYEGRGKNPVTQTKVTQVNNAQPFCPPGVPPAQHTQIPPAGGFDNYPPLSEINPSPQNLADEYLFDGGDRKQKVYKDQQGMQGLNSEDTIAEYKDEEGKTHYKPSNKVAVYSPKFGAVSSTSDPVVQENVDKVLAAHDQIKISGVNTKAGSLTRQKDEKLNIDQVRSGPSGLDHKQEFGNVYRTESSGLKNQLDNPVMERNNQVAAQHRLKQNANVVNTVLAAQLWTRVLNPVIVANDQQANETYSRFREQEIVGVDEKRKAPGNLAITKHADKIQAVEGDIITFQIEFENTGDNPLSDVRIIDNLTPRLQFIQGSATCSLAGKLDVQDNGEGSLILRWELAEPLKPHTKGVVSFKTEVH